MKKSKTRYRIYHKDKITDKIWYFETKWPSISYDYLEQYLKINNKNFLYATIITDGKKSKEQNMIMS